MRSRFHSSRRVAAVVLLALTLTILSAFVERKGPELAAYGNLCGTNGDQDCLEPVLNAGFPFAYLFDQQGVSVEKTLSFAEDRFRPIPFALDFVVCSLLSVICLASIQIVRNTATRLSNRGDN